MTDLLLKALFAILTRLITDTLLAKTAIRILWYFASKTTTELDNGVIEDVARELGIADYK